MRSRTRLQYARLSQRLRPRKSAGLMLEPIQPHPSCKGLTNLDSRKLDRKRALRNRAVVSSLFAVHVTTRQLVKRTIRTGQCVSVQRAWAQALLFTCMLRLRLVRDRRSLSYTLKKASLSLCHFIAFSKSRAVTRMLSSSLTHSLIVNLLPISLSTMF